MRLRRKLSNLTKYIFIAMNIVVIVAMNFCAYTSYLHPSVHPNWSYFGLLFPVFLALNMLFLLGWLVVKWRMIALPLFGMALCASSVWTYCPLNFKKDIPEGSLCLMSYNVMNFGGPPMSDVDYDNNPIVQNILNSGADIVCIQEGSVVGMTRLVEVLNTVYPYIQQGAEDGCHYNACISKYPIVDAQNVPFESKTNRSYAYKLLVGADTLLVINNHLESYRLHDEDYQDYKDIIRHPKDTTNIGRYTSLTRKLITANAVRGRQADAVAAYADSVPCKYKVLCGDFNDPSISYTHRRLTRSYRDAYTESGFGPGISFHTNGMYFRIDNILVNDNIDTYHTKVDNSMSESDHYPIISHLFLKEK